MYIQYVSTARMRDGGEHAVNLAIVAPEQIPVPPPLGGSVEISVWAVAKELAQWHSVTVISRAHSRYPKESWMSGVRILRVQGGNAAEYLGGVLRSLSGGSWDAIQVDNRPSFVPAIKRRFPHVPVSLFVHSLTFVSPPYARRRQAEEGLAAADIIVANSWSLRHELAARFPFAAEKMRVVWLGVDTGRFCPAMAPADRPLAKDGLTVLFAGRLIPRKGLHVLLKALRLAHVSGGHRFRLIVAGGSRHERYKRRIRQLARTSGVPVNFLGTVAHRHIHRIYQQADVFICPSQRHEAFGLVNVEAMASGLPVIASRIGGIGEIVVPGWNGLLVSDYANPRAFAEAIAFLSSHPELVRSMGAAARQDCLSRFSWTATAAHLSRLYTHWPHNHGIL